MCDEAYILFKRTRCVGTWFLAKKSICDVFPLGPVFPLTSEQCDPTEFVFFLPFLDGITDQLSDAQNSE